MATFRCPHCQGWVLDHFLECEKCLKPLDLSTADWIEGPVTPAARRRALTEQQPGEADAEQQPGQTDAEQQPGQTDAEQPLNSAQMTDNGKKGGFGSFLVVLLAVIILGQMVGRACGASHAEREFDARAIQDAAPTRPPSLLQPYISSLSKDQHDAVASFYRRNAGLTDSEMQSLEAQLTAAGLRRLSDADIVDRATLVATALRRMDVTECSHFYAGPDVIELGTLTLSVLSQEQRDRFLTIATTALAEELLQRNPAQILTDPEINAAMEAFLDAMPRQDSNHFLTLITHVPEDVRDRCWAARMLYDAGSGQTSFGPTIARLLIG